MLYWGPLVRGERRRITLVSVLVIAVKLAKKDLAFETTVVLTAGIVTEPHDNHRHLTVVVSHPGVTPPMDAVKLN